MSDRYQSLVPRPLVARRGEGSVELGRDTVLVAGPGAGAAADAVRVLLAPLRLPLRPASDAGTDAVTVRLDPTLDGGPEAYRVTVDGAGVGLTGSTVDGVRHAAQVLRQLLPDAAWRSTPPPGTRWTVPCGEVTDAPALAWRGGMLDVTRHFFSKHTLLRYVDLFAMHRLNRLHLHLTDDQGWRIESRRHPRLHEVGAHRAETQIRHDRDGAADGTPHGGYYTLDDLAEVAAYAAERGVTVVPEIDLPGHASALLAAYPEFGTGEHTVRGGWGISNAVVRPLPATVRFLTEVLDELADAVPGPYVHLGGDEVPMRDWAADPEIRAHQEALGYDGPIGLFGHFLRELATHLAGRGRQTLVWDEGFVGGGMLPDSIVTAWRGDAVARRAAAACYRVVRCPVYPTYFDYDQSDRPDEPLSIGGPNTLADVAGFEPVPGTWSGAERANVIGAQFQVWSEYIPDARHLDYMVFPRASAFAEVAWTGRPAGDIRLDDHLGRLAAAGCGFRPLDGPLPWQTGGTGRRRRAPGTRIAQVREYLENASEHAEVPADGVSL
ncbi:beta-N-acetylhexosaminidase [Virgisporangium ochraceum]|uniref:beta-N-acetylhexosaminidase n=1 Tax=Virgisporangium ochraceum TaxID=65505 RepID=A0A8J4EGJ8_9ACTN|nr:beta-N-acetylhexosaminidase [Virgisporangium ochraceum]GIJ73768.1 beta-N-acetylhexosaminidase [Virgisporangium ochraceum]